MHIKSALKILSSRHVSFIKQPSNNGVAALKNNKKKIITTQPSDLEYDCMMRYRNDTNEIIWKDYKRSEI